MSIPHLPNKYILFEDTLGHSKFPAGGVLTGATLEVGRLVAVDLGVDAAVTV